MWQHNAIRMYTKFVFVDKGPIKFPDESTTYLVPDITGSASIAAGSFLAPGLAHHALGGTPL